MKRAISLISALILILSSFAFVLPTYAKGDTMVSNKLPKHISIVYDDSGSMANGDCASDKNDGDVRSWSQAKYSLEALVGMLDDEDTLEIYKLSGKGKVDRTIVGEKKSTAVRNIHNGFKTGDCGAGTPIDALEVAAKNLANVDKSKERWLVVLTDGNFNKVDAKDVDKKLQGYGKDFDNRVIVISIEYKTTNKKTPKPAQYSQNGFKQYYAKKTDKQSIGDAILESVEKATTQIYSSSRNIVEKDDYDEIKKDDNDNYYVDVNTRGLSLSQFIVFAQGKGVNTSKLAVENTKAMDIPVKYTPVDDLDKVIDFKTGGGSTFKGTNKVVRTDESLEGVVSTFSPKGDNEAFKTEKSVRVSFGKVKPKKLTMYYEPYVGITYDLSKDKNSYLNPNSSEVPVCPEGEYKLTADVVDGLTDEPVNSVLGPVMTFTIDGVEHSLDEMQKGIPVKIDKSFNTDGISAKASILDGRYNISTDDLLNKLKNIIVKDFYKLIVDFQLPKDKKTSFRFKKTDFTLHSLKKLSTDDEKHCLVATVKCVDNDGNKIDLKESDWQAIQDAYYGNSKDGSYCYIGIPSEDKKNVKIDYSRIEFKALENGVGTFVVAPNYIKKDNGKPDKKHTTHKNYIKKSDKYNCKIMCDITLPNATVEHAFSTIITPMEQKSAIFEVALCIWHTIVTAFIIFCAIGYFFKRKLPRKRNSVAKNYSVETKSINYRARGNKETWTAEDEDYYSDLHLKIKRGFWSHIIPYLPQRGELNLKTAGLPTLKLKGVERFGKRTKVRLLNSADGFAGVTGIEDPDEENCYLKTNSGNITKSFLEAKKKPYEFNLVNLRFGGFDGDVFRRYKDLNFKKSKKKR